MQSDLLGNKRNLDVRKLPCFVKKSARFCTFWALAFHPIICTCLRINTVWLLSKLCFDSENQVMAPYLIEEMFITSKHMKNLYIHNIINSLSYNYPILYKSTNRWCSEHISRNPNFFPPLLILKIERGKS